MSNGTAEPIDVELYPAAAVIRDGSFSVLDGRATNALTSWTSVTPARTHLDPGRRQRAEVVVRVPPSAPRGEQYAAILAELPPRGEAGGIAVVSRVGVRMYLSVGTGAEPRTDFQISSLTASREASGQAVVAATVRNTGERAVDLSGDLRLANGPGGASAGPFPARVGTSLAPGQAAPVRVVIDKEIPDGPWKATISLRSGDLERRGEATISFSRPGTTAAPVKVRDVTGTGRGRLSVAVAAGLLLIVGALLSTLIVGARRRRLRAERASSGS